VVIPNGITALVIADGTNFYNAISGSVGNFTVNGNLAVTGTTALSGALTYGGVTLSNAVTGTGSMALSASPTFTGTPIAPTAAPGTNTTQIATTAFALANSIPSGAIILWSGSIASIPSGWLLCDGTSGTPDLRNRFIVGAGSTYAVAATGGTADAVVVSHTHTATDSGHTHGLGNTVSTTTPGSVVTYTGPGGGNAFQSINTLTGSTNSGTANISVSTTGVSGTNQNLPPYYALAYIMKT
jgi:hypothetical protein